MNKLILLFLISLTFPINANSAGIYKWVDDNGRIHYGDKPNSISEKITIRSASSYPPVPITQKITPESGISETNNQEYKISITSPLAQETIRNAEGKVNVNLTVQPLPPIDSKHQIYLDGKLINGSSPAMQLTLTGIERGSHSLRVELLDTEGRLLAKSDEINFHLRQPSVNDPLRSKSKNH